jgi:hypothetical protein
MSASLCNDLLKSLRIDLGPVCERHDDGIEEAYPGGPPTAVALSGTHNHTAFARTFGGLATDVTQAVVVRAVWAE